MFLLTLLAAVQAPAPAPASSGPPPEFLAAAQSLSLCLSAQLKALPQTVAPEAGAQQVVAACRPQRTALDAQFTRFTSGPGVPAADRDKAKAQYEQQMGQIPAQITAALQQRAAALAKPTPHATPTPTGR